ncbi:dihydroxyacetone kinase subunit DhaL [Kitasatospora sp. NPDC094028]
MNVAFVHCWITSIKLTLEEHRDRLTELDSVIGDGDHGVNLARGFARAALEIGAQPRTDETVGGLLDRTGGVLISTVGGAAGPLYGSAFRAMGTAIGAAAETDEARFAEALQAGLDVLQRLGAATPGDKTMVDAYAPAVAAFRDTADARGGFPAAARAAADAAEAALDTTIALRARKGRASYLGLRTIGHQDPGAASTVLVFRALADTIGPRRSRGPSGG